MKLPVPNIQEGADVDLALTVETDDLDSIANVRGHFVGPVLKNLLLGDVRQSPYALDGVLVRLSAFGGDVRHGSQDFELSFEEGDAVDGDEELELEPEREGVEGGADELQDPPPPEAAPHELVAAHERLQGAYAALREVLAVNEQELTALRKSNAELQGLVREREKMIGDLQHLQRTDPNYNNPKE